MIVYFKNSNGKSRAIGEVAKEEDVFELINDFLDKHNFTSYYIRTWCKNKRKWYDVGSHTEFFYINVENEKEL